jgi:tRNA dimethylallyltransferase
LERKVLVIVGPTCSGKTEVAIKVAKKLNSEIISADSRQIYKFLDIGTAKPDESQLAEVKHHFIDELTPDEEFNVSKFETRALLVITTLINNNRIPIVAGGSGLYIKALVDGIFDIVDTDPDYRKKLQIIREEHGNESLYAKLLEVDPVSAKKMLPQNYKRVIRALEVFYLTGIPVWKHQEEHKRSNDIEFLQFGLEWERNTLYKNIELRVDKMLSKGLIKEVKILKDKGFNPGMNALNTVGYKELFDYLDGKISLDRALELIKRNSRRFAKRQLTWFRADKRINWIKIDNRVTLDNAPNIILNSLNR